MKQNQTREFWMYHNEQPKLQLMAGAPNTEESGTSMMNQHQWTQQMVGKDITDRLQQHIEDLEVEKIVNQQDYQILTHKQLQ